jgi:hypothetical protein
MNFIIQQPPPGLKNPPKNSKLKEKEENPIKLGKVENVEIKN